MEAAGRLSEAYTQQYEHYFYLMQRHQLLEQLRDQNGRLLGQQKKEEENEQNDAKLEDIEVSEEQARIESESFR